MDTSHHLIYVQRLFCLESKMAIVFVFSDRHSVNC
jgi:hypothetical protein